VYFGSVFVIAPIGYFINMRRARKMTIPNEPFHQLLLSEDENVRNATMLAVCLSDFLDLANQNITDAHMRPISEGLRASRRLEWMKYVRHARPRTGCDGRPNDKFVRAAVARPTRSVAWPTTGSPRVASSCWPRR